MYDISSNHFTLHWNHCTQNPSQQLPLACPDSILASSQNTKIPLHRIKLNMRMSANREQPNNLMKLDDSLQCAVPHCMPLPHKVWGFFLVFFLGFLEWNMIEIMAVAHLSAGDCHQPELLLSDRHMLEAARLRCFIRQDLVPSIQTCVWGNIWYTFKQRDTDCA